MIFNILAALGYKVAFQLHHFIVWFWDIWINVPQISEGDKYRIIQNAGGIKYIRWKH
jgi:hypothetical protein